VCVWVWVTFYCFFSQNGGGMIGIEDFILRQEFGLGAT